MRLELALIVGVVVFCCWCAFIMLKMNSLLSAISTGSGQLMHPSSQQNLNQQSAKIGTLGSSLTSSTNWAQPAIFNPNNNNNNIPLSAQDANQNMPLKSLESPWISGQQSTGLANTNQRYLFAAGSPEPRWTSWSGVGGSISGQQTDNNNFAHNLQPLNQQQQQQQQHQQQNYYQQEHSQLPVASLPTNVASETSQDLAPAEYEYEDDDGADQDQDEPAVGRRKEEGRGRRSFSDEESSSSERDHNGRLLKSRHRRLLNGREVAPRPEIGREATRSDRQTDGAMDGQPVEDETESGETDEEELDEGAGRTNEPEGGRSIEATNSEPVEDVEETDVSGDNDNNNDNFNDLSQNQEVSAASERQQLLGRRVRATRDGKTTTARVAPSKPEKGKINSDPLDESEPTNKKVSRAHKLREHLSAQQWDDDATGNSVDESPEMQSRPRIGAHSRPLARFTRQASDEPNSLSVSLVPAQDVAVAAQPEVPPPATTVVMATTGSAPVPVNGQSSEPGQQQQQQQQSVQVAPVGQYPLRPEVSIDTSMGGQHIQVQANLSPQRQMSQLQVQRAESSGKPKSVRKKKKKSKKAKMEKMKKSHMEQERRSKSDAMERKKKYKQGAMKKKKKKKRQKFASNVKQFKGSTMGKKAAKGDAVKGAKKGAIYLKDKGYKKKGFKKSYQRMESGDHKTYFDVFRDKDHKKKWKNSNDKHKYSQMKKWTGNDKKKYKNVDLKDMKHKSSKEGAWKKKKASNYDKDYKYSAGKKKSYKSKKSKKKMEKHKKGNFFGAK